MEERHCARNTSLLFGSQRPPLTSASLVRARAKAASLPAVSNVVAWIKRVQSTPLVTRICLGLAFLYSCGQDYFDNGSLDVAEPSLSTCQIGVTDSMRQDRRSGQHDVTKQAIATRWLWAVINIGDRDFSAALFRVAIYSFKSLDGQLIEDTFDYARVRGRPTGTTLTRQADAQGAGRTEHAPS